MNLDLETSKKICAQKEYKQLGLTTGCGEVKRTKHGAFVVFSRTSLLELTCIIKSANPLIEKLSEMKTIFLMGPTPTFFGENRATTSWRREFVAFLDNHPEIDDSFMIAIPEPFDCNWKTVDYTVFDVPLEHVYAQIHWEDFFITLAKNNGILVLHAHFMWKGNAGPTARCEAGMLFDAMREDKVNACVINYPAETQTAQYIDAHILDAKVLYERFRFTLTQCSPLKTSTIIDAGVYPNGASDPGQLDHFFSKIVHMAISIK